MNRELVIIIGLAAAFLLFIVTIYIMKKKNLLGGAPKSERNGSSGSDDDKLRKLERENDKLREELEQVQAQNRDMLFKIESLKSSNVDLKKQKDYLVENKKKLLELQKEKDDLFTIVMHDIKNPASAIQNFVKLLESYDLNAVEQHQIMESLVTTSSRILKLAEEVSHVMSVESRLFQVKYGKHKITDIIDIVKKRFENIAQQKSIAIYVHEGIITPVEMDADKIEEVLDNLVSNAIKFAPMNSAVNIKAGISEGKLNVEVIDDGYGLSPEDIQRAFTKGAKLSNRPTGGENSTGLGLWIVKRIIDEHKGRVWIKSKKGQGSTFAFQIPVANTRMTKEIERTTRNGG
ncbi:MAG: HAMP domain-containing sensor histidine kinase [bacterium]